MRLQGRWTRFQIEAEVEHFGVGHIVDMHNALIGRIDGADTQHALLGAHIDALTTDLAHEEGLHAVTQMELSEARARVACLVSDLRMAEAKMASTIGRKGGKATGEAKRRGDSAHYKALRARVGKR